MKDKIKLSILWIFSFLVIIFMMTFSSHAEESPSYPMIIDFAKNPIDTTIEEIQNAYAIMWGDLPDSYILYCSSHDTQYINGSHGWDYYDTYTYVISIDPVFDYPLELSVTSPYYYLTNGVEYYFQYIPDIDHWGNYNSATNIRHQYAYSYMAQGLGWLLYGTDDEYTSIQDVVVWSHAHEDPVIVTGHATAPDPFENPTVNSGSNHTLPREVPESPTINNYIWNTYNPPAIDTTNLESLLESLIYVINYLAGWLRDNLAGEFQNLISNITGLINYIAETIQYYCGLIISNIQNGIKTFYNNMVSLFEPIAAKIDYLTEPVDGTIIYDNLSSTSLVTNISTIQTSLTSFQAAFTGIDEPSSYTIPIHLENLPSNWFGTQTTQYIDLGVINGTVKDGLRLFVWAMVTYSLVVTIFDSISNYINGGGDES